MVQVFRCPHYEHHTTGGEGALARIITLSTLSIIVSQDALIGLPASNLLHKIPARLSLTVDGSGQGTYICALHQPEEEESELRDDRKPPSTSRHSTPTRHEGNAVSAASSLHLRANHDRGQGHGNKQQTSRGGKQRNHRFPVEPALDLWDSSSSKLHLPLYRAGNLKIYVDERLHQRSEKTKETGKLKPWRPLF
ncbi:hypothetical protein MRX96_041410 [Rhipicephalus microplus]